ncbi:MAG: patatin-like phospholipase family protein [Thermoanaerobaculaceae bacterium]|nr:patatin-like phospholipase family protein [Thermoanaerobaculaceae bacterium]MDI9621795.1 patatin-like phospholipase family protein [Acidobacteriota bacterium]NLH10496.1 BamA/TamA family outer membrane protein [Holophagae bacterium]
MRLPRAVLAAALCLALPAAGRAAPAQETAPHRPRIGLVLSGGGALGLAHIGVLKVLEELHVPVDCVAGTSMGAIVGGLYAAGYAPEEIERLAYELPWNRLIEDQPDRRHLPYRRKVDDQTYLTPIQLGLSGGRLRMPSGLIAGHRLGIELRLLTLRVLGSDDFDRLPLPFRAVAADIGTGEMVVLRRGELARAMRASMAVPGVFSPVELDGRLLVDGGVVDNLPVDQARAMGADIVIAVDVGTPMAAKRRPDSIASILSRTTDMLTRVNVERMLPSVDLLIQPEVRTFGLLDFDQGREILPKGETAARARAVDLARLAVDDGEWQAFLRRHRRTTPQVRITALSVDPGPGLDQRTISHQVKTRPGTTLDPEELRGDLRRLWELGEFETVTFDVVPADDGWELRLIGKRKSWGPNFLRFGLSMTSDLEGESHFNLLGSIAMTRINRLGGELKAAVQAGGDPLALGEIYQPLQAGGPLFVAASAGLGSRKVQLPIGSHLEQYRFAAQRVGADLGLALGRYGELRAGLRYDTTRGQATADRRDALPHFARDDGGWRLGLALDQLDNVNFPRTGFLAVTELYEATEKLGADIPYRRLDLNAVLAASRGRHTLITFAHGSSALGGTLPPSERIGLGGLFNLTGLPPGEISGSYGGVAGLIYLYKLGQLPIFGRGVYAGLSLETGNAWNTAHEVRGSELRRSGAALFGADTLLGPLYFGWGTTSGGKDSFYLLLGRTF